MSLKISERIETLQSALTRAIAVRDEMKALQRTEDKMYENWEPPGEGNHALSVRYRSALQEMYDVAQMCVNMLGDTNDAWTYVPADDRDLNDAITSITIDAVNAANNSWATLTFAIGATDGFSVISNTFQIGDEITLSGFSTSANNTDYRILDIDTSAEEVDLSSAGDTDESAVTDAEIDLKSRPIDVKKGSDQAIQVDADNGSSECELILSSGSWGNEWDAGESVVIMGAEESANDGTYTIDSVTTTSSTRDTLVLTAAATTDNADDEAIVVCLL
jgi:hypothetical protein